MEPMQTSVAQLASNIYAAWNHINSSIFFSFWRNVGMFFVVYFPHIFFVPITKNAKWAARDQIFSTIAMVEHVHYPPILGLYTS